MSSPKIGGVREGDSPDCESTPGLKTPTKKSLPADKDRSRAERDMCAKKPVQRSCKQRRLSGFPCQPHWTGFKGPQNIQFLILKATTIQH